MLASSALGSVLRFVMPWMYTDLPDEAIKVLALLWAGDAEGVSHQSEFFAFDRICSFPKPYQGSTLPIHVNGFSAAARRDPGALDYTRRGGIDLSPDDVRALADEGVTRLVISPSPGPWDEQRDELSAFARRHGLG